VVEIYVDADACPVKAEIYRVAGRSGIKVWIVSNGPLRLPNECLSELVVVGSEFDAADNWIADRSGPGAVVVTADVPLASRCVAAGAVVLGPDGRGFTENSVGMALAMRNLMQDLREAGAVTGGPRPFSARDRSAFLSALDLAILRLKRSGFAP